jgi:hypothetical protein
LKQLLQAWWAVPILALVALIAIPMFWGELDRNYAVMKTKQDILTIETALHTFKTRHGNYPTQEGGLASLDGSIIKRLRADRWGGGYRYYVDPNGMPVVYSSGANRRDEAGLGDDIIAGDKAYRCEDYEAYCLRATDVAARIALGLAAVSVLVGIVRGAMRLRSVA